MFELLTNDREFADHNKAIMQGWLSVWVPRCIEAARALQPLWSQPDAKPPRFEDGLDRVQEPLHRHPRPTSASTTTEGAGACDRRRSRQHRARSSPTTPRPSMCGVTLMNNQVGAVDGAGHGAPRTT